MELVKPFIKKISNLKIFETISQLLVSAVDRDILSGWGAYVYVMTPGAIAFKKMKMRQGL